MIALITNVSRSQCQSSPSFYFQGRVGASSGSGTGRGPKGAEIRVFSPLPPPFSLFLYLSGCLLVEFHRCLNYRGLGMYTFGEREKQKERNFGLSLRGGSGNPT